MNNFRQWFSVEILVQSSENGEKQDFCFQLKHGVPLSLSECKALVSVLKRLGHQASIVKYTCGAVSSE